MSPVVTKYHRSLVRPHGRTPSGTLPLSPIDKLPIYRDVFDLLQVFPHGRQPAKVIREALSLALDHYYPLAGKLMESEGDDLVVACTQDGSWFIEASADCSLENVNHLDRPLMIPEEDLIPYPRPGLDPEDALVMIQVTEFTCGGFAVCARSNHVVIDGIGLGQFLKAVGEIARGLIEPKIAPVWSRECIPVPLQVSRPPLPFLEHFPLEYSMVDFPLDTIKSLKRQFREETGGRSCTTFEVLGAKLWQCWTRAAGHDPLVDVHFGFPANLRPVLHHLLPPEGGYYGNCIYSISATARSGKLASASIAEIVDLIREAKERVPVEFWKWVRGELGEDPRLSKMRSTYELVVVVDWRKIGLSEVDYGWGEPTRYGPLTRNGFFPSCNICSPPAPMQGARLVMRALRKEHLAAFLNETMCVEATNASKSIVPAIELESSI